MTTFNTGNPIGSTDARDLSDNAENFDKALGTLDATWTDRLGVTRDSFEGRLAKGSFYRVGDFATGYTLTNIRQTLEYSGHEYSWAGEFPKVVPAGSTPETTGGIGAGAWADRTDVSLRSELLSGAITQRNGLFSLRDVVSVKDFGAIGDGIADDTDAINNAISSNDAIFFPSGTYKSTGINLSGVSNKRIFGNGELISATNNGALIAIASGSNNIIIDGLTITGKLSGTIDRGINIDSSYGITIKDCTIRNFNEVGIKYGSPHVYSKTHPITISNNDIVYCGTGILCNGEYAAIQSNRIRLCGTIWSANSTSIDNFGGNASVIGGDSGWGIKGSLGNCRIENNHIQQNFYGLLLDGALGSNPDHSHISGNQINHNQAYGMMISNIGSCEQIIGNEVLSTVGPGVWPPLGVSLSLVLATTHNLSMIGNTIDGGAGNITRLDNVINSHFISNIFYIGANVTEATQCQNNTWIGNDFMGNSVGVARHPSTINRIFFANTLNNEVAQTIPVSPAFTSGWVDFDADLYAQCKYWRDADGYLNIIGVIKSTNAGDAGSVIFSLPSGFRVSKVIDCPVIDSSGAASIRLYPSGDVQMIGGGTTMISINVRVII